MNILNKEELRRQIKEGKEISLDGILEEFKSLLRESIYTTPRKPNNILRFLISNTIK